MKITDIELRQYRWERGAPIRNGMHTYVWTGIGLIHIHTDEGVSGIGWALEPQHAGIAQVAAGLLEYCKPLLIGEDPFNYRRIWEKLWVPKLVGRRGLTTRFISGIDIALWDLMGVATGKSVHKLLGAAQARVPAYIAGGYYEEGKGLAGLAAEMEANLALGAKAVKMKIGGASIAEDVERVRVVRETIGPDVDLMVDANCAYSGRDAVKLARKIERYDIFWFEEPLPPDDYRGHGRLAAATSIPIATGENEYTRYGFRDLIAHDAAAIFNADAQLLGGITEFMNVAALAAAHDLHIAPHGDQEIHLHLVGAIPNGLIVEYYRDTIDANRGNLFEEKLSLDDDGWLTVPDRPGLGFTPNYDFLERHRLA
ncbi:MAG: mandelate racemase/muconate lactonizing enzyme family protein [Chloroflexota bacterium]|nr:mandelate racemase/muconate lactonizing enzyme family protein [Chloroflexota bacterium]MDE2945695.1 mandelate racemase/muconate lactonizing enzyme family protein [Chloroflexota bacterium]